MPKLPALQDSGEPPEKKRPRVIKVLTAEERAEAQKRANERQNEEGRELDRGNDAATLYDKHARHEHGSCALRELEDMFLIWRAAHQKQAVPHERTSMASWLADDSTETRQQRVAHAFMGASTRDQLVELLKSGRAVDGARDLHLVHWRRYIYRCIVDDKLLGGGGQAVHEDAVDLTLLRWQEAVRSSPVLQCLVEGQEPVTAETLQAEVARTPLYSGKAPASCTCSCWIHDRQKVRLAPRHYLPE